MNVSVVISYCSLDKRFIETTIKQSLIFSDDIIVVCFDHLLNGDIEKLEMLDTLKTIDSKKIHILVLPYDSNQTPRHHHNLARWQGQKYTKNQYVLFLDADEIVEGDIFKELLQNINFESIYSISFLCYWYFRSCIYQATTTECSPMLIDKTKFSRPNFFTEHERGGFVVNKPNYIEAMTSRNGEILFHHFSWARTKEEMLLKTSSWGHRHDRDWKSLIEQEFLHNFNGTDFVHGYSYNIVNNKFNLEQF